MRVLIQRVSSASVTVGDEVVGEIGRGLLLLVGIGHDDTPAVVSRAAEKVANLRIFADAAGHMNRSLLDLHGDEPGQWGVLVVSQFTLHADVRRGRRPSFVGAARPEVAVPLLDGFVAALAGRGLPVATGRFGADMRLALVNDGPVTIWLDTDQT